MLVFTLVMIKRISCKPVLELRQSSPISRGLYHVVQIVDLFQSNTNTWPASIEISFEPSGVNLLVFGDLLFGQKSLGHLGMHFRWNIKWVESAFRHNCSQLESCQLHFRPRWNSGWKIWYFRTRQVFSQHRAVVALRKSTCIIIKESWVWIPPGISWAIFLLFSLSVLSVMCS